MLALDDRRLQAELRGADRRDIAAGAGADDDDVVGFQPLSGRIVCGPSLGRASLPKGVVETMGVAMIVSRGDRLG